jgi:hypothetical protein
VVQDKARPVVTYATSRGIGLRRKFAPMLRRANQGFISHQAVPRNRCRDPISSPRGGSTRLLVCQCRLEPESSPHAPLIASCAREHKAFICSLTYLPDAKLWRRERRRPSPKPPPAPPGVTSNRVHWCGWRSQSCAAGSPHGFTPRVNWHRPAASQFRNFQCCDRFAPQQR